MSEFHAQLVQEARKHFPAEMAACHTRLQQDEAAAVDLVDSGS
jgi:hypothetical protein